MIVEILPSSFFAAFFYTSLPYHHLLNINYVEITYALHNIKNFWLANKN